MRAWRRLIPVRPLPGMVTWTCHVCGDEREDAMIGVHRRPVTIGGIRGVTNVRHCVDREECREGAKTHSFFGEEDEG